MADSPLPAGIKIRVLTTIENGQVHHEMIGENQIFATLEEFSEMSRRIGAKNALFEIRLAIELSNQLREAILFWAERARFKNDIERGFNFVDQLNEIIALQKKIIGE